MTAIQGYYNPGDGINWRLAYSLQRLCAEVAVRWPDITNLGGLGDVGHAVMNLNSDHNPFVKKPGESIGIVRAVDFGGPADQLLEMRAELYALGAARFGPLWSFGYLKGPDSQGCAWPIGSGWNHNSGDEGHLHVSVTQVDGYNPVAGTAGYVPAIDSTESWGLVDGAGLTGLALTSTPITAPEAQEDDVPATTTIIVKAGDPPLVIPLADGQFNVMRVAQGAANDQRLFLVIGADLDHVRPAAFRENPPQGVGVLAAGELQHNVIEQTDKVVRVDNSVDPNAGTVALTFWKAP